MSADALAQAKREQTEALVAASAGLKNERMLRSTPSPIAPNRQGQHGFQNPLLRSGLQPWKWPPAMHGLHAGTPIKGNCRSAGHIESTVPTDTVEVPEECTDAVSQSDASGPSAGPPHGVEPPTSWLALSSEDNDGSDNFEVWGGVSLPVRPRFVEPRMLTSPSSSLAARRVPQPKQASVRSDLPANADATESMVAIVEVCSPMKKRAVCGSCVGFLIGRRNSAAKDGHPRNITFTATKDGHEALNTKRTPATTCHTPWVHHKSRPSPFKPPFGLVVAGRGQSRR
jgi:hypothetical protein